MRFTESGGKYKAHHERKTVVIEPNEGGWMVVVDGRSIEWFRADELAAAKKWVKCWMASK